MGTTQSNDSHKNKEYVYEGIFLRIYSDNLGDTSNMRIRCCPIIGNKTCEFILKQNNIKFAEIYNSLIKDKVYEFTYKIVKFGCIEEYVLISIDLPKIHVVIGKVTGFLDLRQEYEFKNNMIYWQLLLEKPTNKRLVTDNKENFEIGSTYEIKYKKDVLDLYEIIEFKKITIEPKYDDPKYNDNETVPFLSFDT